METIDAAIGRVINDGFDCSLTLFEDTTYLWRLEGDTAVPINYEPAKRGPRQKEHWNQWGENKAVYVMTRDLLVDTGCRLGGRIGYVKMSKLDSIDIDAPDDLVLADAILRARDRDDS